MSGSVFARVARLVCTGGSGLRGLLQALAPEPSLEKLLGRVRAMSDQVRSELGKTVASSHLLTKRLAELTEAALESSERRGLARELEESRALEEHWSSSLRRWSTPRRPCSAS